MGARTSDSVRLLLRDVLRGFHLRRWTCHTSPVPYSADRRSDRVSLLRDRDVCSGPLAARGSTSAQPRWTRIVRPTMPFLILVLVVVILHVGNATYRRRAAVTLVHRKLEGCGYSHVEISVLLRSFLSLRRTRMVVNATDPRGRDVRGLAAVDHHSTSRQGDSVALEWRT